MIGMSDIVDDGSRYVVGSFKDEVGVNENQGTAYIFVNE